MSVPAMPPLPARPATERRRLSEFLHGLVGTPAVQEVVAVSCTGGAHGAEVATWFYVEADAAAGVARWRCLGCGGVRHLLGSESLWTHPPMWACHSCAQSIAELAVGLHVEDDVVTWAALAARCVNCEEVDGLTDVLVPGRPVAEVVAELS